MARTGKIARLPWEIREQLNQRLQENEPSEKILEWLNARSDTQEILGLHFDGKPITEVNLSAWRNGGFKEWQEDQRALELVERLADQAQGAEEAAEGHLSERLAVVLTMRLAGLMQKLLAEAENNPPDKQWQYAKELSRELDRVRRSDHRSRRLQVLEERWEWERERQDRQDEAQAKKEETKQMADAVRAAANMPVQAQYYGALTKNPKFGKHIAKSLYAIEHGGPVPADDLRNVGKAKAAPGGEAKGPKAETRRPKGKAKAELSGKAAKGKSSKGGGAVSKPKAANKKAATRPVKGSKLGKAGSQKAGVAPGQEHAEGVEPPQDDAKAEGPAAAGFDELNPSAEPETEAGGGEAGENEPGAELPDTEPPV